MTMMMIRTLVAALLLSGPLHAAETYDLIFRTGTLDDVAPDRMLAYERRVEIAENPEYASRSTGVVELSFHDDDMARLQFVQGDRQQVLGMFPATVGNPIIMYFVETVLRDVAQAAGGSPFYIRNRIKESLVAVAPIEDAEIGFAGTEIAAKEITLHPFRDDPNRDKMGVYGDLALTFTMSDDVPGWYASLSATAPGPDGTVGYVNTLTLLPMVAGK